MKVIFLDVDGVLNCSQTFVKRRKKFNETGQWEIEIDKDCVKRLSKIVQTTSAQIVLSSCWRLGWSEKGNSKHIDELEIILAMHKMFIDDKTPRLDGKRGNEITHWLNENKEVESYVIIDDETCDMLEYVDKNKVVKTSFYDNNGGLQDEHVELAIKILMQETK